MADTILPSAGQTNGNIIPGLSTASCTTQKTSPVVQTISMQTLNDKLVNKGYNPNVVSTMIDSRSKSTYQQYKTYWDRWGEFCINQELDALQAPIVPIINFLQDCRDSFLGYSAVNTARSALSLVIDCPEGPLSQNEDMTVFMRGVRNQTPHQPKYSSIWDADLLLDHLSRLGEPNILDLKSLSIKLTALIFLASGHRVQTLPFLFLDHLVLSGSLQNSPYQTN